MITSESWKSTKLSGLACLTIVLAGPAAWAESPAPAPQNYFPGVAILAYADTTGRGVFGATRKGEGLEDDAPGLGGFAQPQPVLPDPGSLLARNDGATEDGVLNQDDSFEVIVNSASGVRELSRTTLRAIFSMRIRQLPDGTPVTVYVLPDRDQRHRTFCKEFLQVYPYVLRDTWDRMVFTGTGQAPIEVGSQAELIKRVAETRGGIGYVALEGKGSYEQRIKFLEIH